MAAALGIAMLSVIACSTPSAPATMLTPTATPWPDYLYTPAPTRIPPTATPVDQLGNEGGCFLSGRAVPCREFRQQVFDETVADLRALDCNALVNIVALRLDGWRTAELTGRVTYDEGQAAGDAISAAVRQLGCGNSPAWREYLANLP